MLVHYNIYSCSTELVTASEVEIDVLFLCRSVQKMVCLPKSVVCVKPVIPCYSFQL